MTKHVYSGAISKIPKTLITKYLSSSAWKFCLSMIYLYVIPMVTNACKIFSFLIYMIKFFPKH